MKSKITAKISHQEKPKQTRYDFIMENIFFKKFNYKK